MFTIADGRDRLYQWDVDAKLRIDDKVTPAIDEVHFRSKYSKANVLVPAKVMNDEEGPYVIVPNELLQTGYNLVAYAYCCATGNTRYEQEITVMARPKPENYVYSGEEVKTWEALAKQIDEMKEQGTGVNVTGGAAIGQMIVVKAVDEKGKPTEWEAVDKPVHIANVRVDRGRYFFVDGNHETLLNAYNSGATVGLNANGYMYYLANVDGDNNLHFGHIPYSNSDSETANIPNYYLMVAPDNSITQTIRDIATVGFVNQAIAESTPKKLSELEDDLYCKELLALQISGSEMSKDGNEYTFNVDGEHYVNDGTFECALIIDGITHTMQLSNPSPLTPPDLFPDGKVPYNCGAGGPYGVIQIADGFLEGGTPDAPAFSCTGMLTVMIMAPRHEEIILELRQVQTKTVPETAIPDTIARKTDIPTIVIFDYDVSTLEEVEAAYNSGAIMFCRKDNYIMPFVENNSNITPTFRVFRDYNMIVSAWVKSDGWKTSTDIYVSSASIKSQVDNRLREHGLIT